ncbi:MAG: type II secretion system F family protein [Opitutaceae bacterium]
MSLFHYKAYDAAGATITGALEADSVATLEGRLRATGIWLLEAREHGDQARDEKTRISRVRANSRDQIAFFIQMTLLLQSGITLPTALAQLAQDFSDSKLGPVIDSLADRVSVGVPLHEAMEAFPRIFSRQIVAMVEAGEVSGQMPEVFRSLSSYLEWIDELVSEIRQALIYPIIVIAASIGLIVLLFTLVVPRFVTLLTDLSMEVPVLTRIVMALSDLMVKGAPFLIAAAVGIPIALKLALRVPAFGRWFDRSLMRLPIFGQLVSMFALARFSRNLGMLYRSGVTLLKGLEISTGLAGNRAIEFALEKVRKAVTEGSPMSRSLSDQAIFPRTLVTMIATGETSGNLDVALQSVASYYDTIIPRRIKAIFAIFNPVIMLSLIGIVGVVALSVVLPILQLWQVQ